MRAFVGIAALAGILSWSPDGHASHCPDAPSTQATRAVEVQQGDHLVIIEYAARYGTSKDELKPDAAVPDLTVQPYDLQYDSQGCEVLRRHVEWLVGMGVDAIAVDLSRNVRCVFHETEVDGKTCGSYAYPKMKRNVENLYRYFYEHNVPIRIVPLLGANDDALSDDPNGKPYLKAALEFFERLARNQPNDAAPGYPAQVLRYQGRPLMLLYVSSPYKRCAPKADSLADAKCATDFDYLYNAWSAVQRSSTKQDNKQDKFTYRLVTAHGDSQPELWSGQLAEAHVLAHREQRHAPASWKIWSWLDRFSPEKSLLPSVSLISDERSPADGKAESFMVTTAFSYADGSWKVRGAEQPVLASYMDLAKRLHPRFLIVRGFNDFQRADQGLTNEQSDNIEPARAVNSDRSWETTYIDAFRQSLATDPLSYRRSIPRPINFSARASTNSSDRMMTMSFTIRGVAPKTVLITAKGPSLASYFGKDALPDPRIRLFSMRVPDHPALIAANDNAEGATNYQAMSDHRWSPPRPDKEPAILMDLEPGTYAVEVTDTSGSQGMTILEVNEIREPGFKIGNAFASMSTKVWVGPGVENMIGGFVISGHAPQKVVVRVRGPSLGSGALQHPHLDLYRESSDPKVPRTLLASNDKWGDLSSANKAELARWQLQPGHRDEAAIIMDLDPAQVYTAVVAGTGDTSGAAIVEIFAVPLGSSPPPPPLPAP